MIKYKLKYYISKFKFILYILIILGLSILIYSIINQENPSPTFSTIVGAIVGGSFSIIATSLAHSKQVKAQLNIKRRNIIYSPLYDELSYNQNLLVNVNPYPTYITFTLGPQTIVPHPQYSAWGRIKNDTRFLETPKVISIKMDELYLNINNYLNKAQKLTYELQKKYNFVHNKLYGTTCTIQNIGQVILSEVLIGEYFDFYRKSVFSASDEIISEKDKQKKIEFNDIFISEYNKIQEVHQVRSIYKELIEKQQEILVLLGFLIKMVNNNY